MPYELSKHLILLYFISLLLGISCISFLIVLCKKENNQFYIQIKNFHIALLVYVLYSFSDYYKSFFIQKWEMSVFFTCLSNLVTLFFVYNWWRLNFQTMGDGKWLRLYKVIRAEGILYFIAWVLVYLLFMDKEYEFFSLAGKVFAALPDSLFYISIIAVNIYFIRSASGITEEAKKSALLFINIIALLINCWGYMNDFALIFYPLGAEIIDMYPFNPVIAVYLLVNILTMGYLYKNNVFTWQIDNPIQDEEANTDISAYPFEEIEKRFHLTKREVEIIHLVYQGRSNPEISECLNISTGTVKRHIQNIFRKMDIKNRYELIYLIKSE